MALKRLEPCAGKLARTVLRRVVAGNSHGLSDNLPFVAGDYPNCMYVNDDWSKKSNSPQAVKQCIDVVQKRINSLEDYSKGKVYAEDKTGEFVIVVYKKDGTDRIHFWGNWMPNSFIDENNPPKGFPDGHICDIDAELQPVKNGFITDVTGDDVVFQITEKAVTVSDFVPCSPRRGSNTNGEKTYAKGFLA